MLPGMTRENLHLQDDKPLLSFDLSEVDQLKNTVNYSNNQPWFKKISSKLINIMNMI